MNFRTITLLYNKTESYFKLQDVKIKDSDHDYYDAKNVTLLTNSSTESHPTENYLTYLPHSGFHNQRMALENAIFLAWYLNRTLILPPIIFLDQLKAVPWTTSLYPQLDALTRHKKFTFLYWEEIMNMEWVKQHVRIVYRTDFSLQTLLTSIDVTEDQVILIKDEFKYQHRLYDDPTSNQTLGKFKERVNLSELKESSVEKRLIHFGSLYGGYRVNRGTPQSKRFWWELVTHFVPNNQVLLETVRKVVYRLGGLGKFVGVHARLGNSSFKRDAEIHIKVLTRRLETDFTRGTIKRAALLSSHRTDNPLFDSCGRESVKPGTIPLIIFVASDVKKTNPLFREFLEKFPCTFTLADFDYLLEPLRQVIDPLALGGKRETNMYKLLSSLVDLLVASGGGRFYGTSKSTFSTFAKRIHEHRHDDLISRLVFKEGQE